jgi:choline kinase
LQAVILAAGLGKRLKPVTDILPKGLIEIRGKSLLEYSLNALSQNGIKEVIIIVGFLHKAIKQKFKEDYSGLKITYVLNKEYSKTGSMYSFSKVKEIIKGDIILLESDLLYEPNAIKVLLDFARKDAILVSRLSGSRDEVYICVDDNQRIIELGKNINEQSRKKAVGELVGISKFSREFLSELFEKAEEDYEKGKLNYHYEECVFATSKSGRPVYAVLCKDLTWIEIDNENDLKKAREQVYSRIKNDLIW